MANAARAAEALLSRVWKGRGFPVDPVQIAKGLGVDVVVAELPERVAGAIIKDAGKDPVIFLSQSDSGVRQRFTCAHELGHYVYRQENDGAHYEYVELRGDHSSEGNNQEEIFANQFAANLLMPANEVKNLWEQGLSRTELAYMFRVSDDAMRYRIMNLRLR